MQTVDGSKPSESNNDREIADEDATSRIGGTFNYCSKLEKVYLPEVTTLGDMAFSGCKALKEIELPEATEIGLSALMNCSSLVSVRLPKATYFGRDVFTSCEALSQLYLLAEGGISVQNTTFGSADSIAKNVDLTLNANKKGRLGMNSGKGKNGKAMRGKASLLPKTKIMICNSQNRT